MNFVIAATVLFAAICVQSTQGTGHPLDVHCASWGYSIGACGESLTAVANAADPDRCTKYVRCAHYNRVTKKYVDIPISAAPNDTPCGSASDSTILGCNNGVCNKRLNVYVRDLPSPKLGLDCARLNNLQYDR